MATLFEELSKESGIQTDTFKVWGTEVYLRSLNATEIIDYNEDVEAGAEMEKKVQGVVLLVHTLADGNAETGARVSKEERTKFLQLLLSKDFRTVQSLVRRSRELNGLQLTTPAKAGASIKNA